LQHKGACHDSQTDPLNAPLLSANPISHFLAQVFLGLKLSSESSESLIGLLAYLQPKLRLKNNKLVKILHPQTLTLGILYPWPEHASWLS